MLQAEIRVRGQIDEHWSGWFEEFNIKHTNQGETILTGNVIDQSTLYGVIAKLRDLGLPLISVNTWETDTKRENVKVT